MRIISALVFFGLTAPAMAAPPVVVTGAWARATLPHQDEGAAYLTLQSATADSLTDISSPQAGMVMLHQTTAKNGMAAMADLASLALPPGAKVTLSPGGTHLMLMDLPHALKAGDTLHLTLHFAKGGDQEVDVPVLSVHATGPQ